MVDLLVDCGETEKCIGPPTLRTASLVYGADDDPRELTIRQYQPGSKVPGDLLATNPAEVPFAGRTVRLVELTVVGGGFTSFDVRWQERPDLLIVIEAQGVTRADLEAFVAALRPGTGVELDRLLASEAGPACVSADHLLAPTRVPAGWTLYVLAARPLGSCAGGPILDASLVGGPQGFLTVHTSAAASVPKEPTEELGRREVYRSREDGPLGETSLIQFRDGELWVTISVMARSDTDLAAIVDGLYLVDAGRWAALVDASAG